MFALRARARAYALGLRDEPVPADGVPKNSANGVRVLRSEAQGRAAVRTDRLARL